MQKTIHDADDTTKVSEFDNNGNLKSITHFDPSGIRRQTYQLMSNGSLTMFYDDDGDVRKILLSAEDSKGRMIAKVGCDLKEVDFEFFKLLCNADGIRIKQSVYNSDGAKIGIDEFDASGNNCTSMVRHHPDGRMKFICGYDRDGIWKTIVYDADGTTVKIIQ